jgi:hypothetical protein
VSLIVHCQAADGALFDVTMPDPVILPPPSKVLDLSTWKINLPNGAEVKGHAAMQALDNEWFRVTPDGAVQFTVPTNGVGTPTYPRSELREMFADGLTAQAWSTSSGTHTMTIRQRVTHLPVVKPETVCGQIHNADSANSGPEFLIVAYGPPLKDPTRIQLRAFYYWENVQVTLDPDYKLGTWFDLKIVASGGFVDVYYNGVLKGHRALAITGCYGKAGCYGQSTETTPGAYSQVEISSLTISHA